MKMSMLMLFLLQTLHRQHLHSCRKQKANWQKWMQQTGLELFAKMMISQCLMMMTNINYNNYYLIWLESKRESLKEKKTHQTFALQLK